MEKLAIHGGKPVRDTQIHYGRQYIDENDVKAVRDVLLSDLITTGPKVQEMEEKLCELTGAKYAVGVANGTAALHAACFAADIGNDDEMITTPFTFAASANCALYFGARPVFADINPFTYNISPEEIKKRISEKTKAVVAVDFAGQAVEADEIRDICSKNGLLFIEDASHSIGTKYNGRAVGSLADMTTFSFHPVKTITGGEGGAILTDSEELYQKLMLFRTHGITRNPDLMEYEFEGTWYYEQIALGYNYRITDFQAALIISQMNKLDMFAKRRKEIVIRYNDAFSKIPEIVLHQSIPQSNTVNHLYVIQLKLEMLTASRKEVYDALYAENVCCNVHYIPVYTMPYYQKLGYKRGLCPTAEALYERIISLPLYYGMTEEDVDSVIEAVHKVVSYYRIG